MSTPNMFSVVQEVESRYPNIIYSESKKFTDIVAYRLSKIDPRWGRKVRIANDWESRNDDALAYRNSSDSDKDYVDIVQACNSPNAAIQWLEFPGPNTGNGYWMRAREVEETPTPDPDPNPNPDPSIINRLNSLEAKVLKYEEVIVKLRAVINSILST